MLNFLNRLICGASNFNNSHYSSGTIFDIDDTNSDYRGNSVQTISGNSLNSASYAVSQGFQNIRRINDAPGSLEYSSVEDSNSRGFGEYVVTGASSCTGYCN